MDHTPLHVFPSPAEIGRHVAELLLRRIEAARSAGARFLLGCPTGRTPRPVFDAMATRLGDRRQDLSHVSLVMMDEYLIPGPDGLQYAPAGEPWSCHHFAREVIVDPLNAALPANRQLQTGSVWFPEPGAPEAYDARIAEAGGIDLFMLASGASDGHVAFNPPGSDRDSRTRVIELSEETRHDNLQTFPSFGTLDKVPHHGVSVGIGTITSAREAMMIVWGAGKRRTLARMLATERYEAEWPATLIHECASREIVSDAACAEGVAAS